MLEGEFDESARAREEARRAARAAGPDALRVLAHATDTAAVDAAYVGRIDAASTSSTRPSPLLGGAGQLDEVMRCYANKTTLLDLDLRREQALDGGQGGDRRGVVATALG